MFIIDVNCVRFSPDGTEFVSVSSDKTGVFYDGKTGQKTNVLDKTGAHTGSIFSVAWSPDGKQLTTSGGDKANKIWDSSTKKLINSIQLGSTPDGQQVSCLWPLLDCVISLSLNGTLNFIDPTDTKATKPKYSIFGHNTPIYKLIYHKETNSIFSCASEGIIIQWDYGTSKNRLLQKTEKEKGSINGIGIAGRDLVSISLEGLLRFTPLDTFTITGEPIKLKGTPNDLSIGSEGDLIVVSNHNSLEIIKGKK